MLSCVPALAGPIIFQSAKAEIHEYIHLASLCVDSNNFSCRINGNEAIDSNVSNTLPRHFDFIFEAVLKILLISGSGLLARNLMNSKSGQTLKIFEMMLLCVSCIKPILAS